MAVGEGEAGGESDCAILLRARSLPRPCSEDMATRTPASAPQS